MTCAKVPLSLSDALKRVGEACVGAVLSRTCEALCWPCFSACTDTGRKAGDGLSPSLFKLDFFLRLFLAFRFLRVLWERILWQRAAEEASTPPLARTLFADGALPRNLFDP